VLVDFYARIEGVERGALTTRDGNLSEPCPVSSHMPQLLGGWLIIVGILDIGL